MAKILHNADLEVIGTINVSSVANATGNIIVLDAFSQLAQRTPTELLGDIGAFGLDQTIPQTIFGGVPDFSTGLATSSVQFDTNATPLVGTPGLLQWNEDEDTLDLTARNGVTYQLGQEIAPLIRNNTGTTIPDGTPVMFSGTLGASGRVTVTPAIADGSIKSSYILGLTTQEILNGQDGHVTTFGKIRGLDTTGTPYGEVWNEGDLLYVSATTAGFLTNVKPQAPNAQIFIGVIINIHAQNGTIFTRSSWRGNLEDLDDVNGTPLTTTGQIMVWDETQGYFDFTSNISDFAPTNHTHLIADVTDFTDNSANWNIAFGWGDHALAGYLTSYTETDPVFTASDAAGITGTQITNWDTAFGWGNHAGLYVDFVSNQYTIGGEKTFTGAVQLFDGRVGVQTPVFGGSRLGDAGFQTPAIDTQAINFKDAGQLTATAMFTTAVGGSDGYVFTTKNFVDDVLVWSINGLGAATYGGVGREVESTLGLRNDFTGGQFTVLDMFNQDYDAATEVANSSGWVAIHGGGATAKEIGLWRYDTTTYTPIWELSPTNVWTFGVDVNVPDEVYGVGWDGSTEVPTKNAVYDKIETVADKTIIDFNFNSGTGNLSLTYEDLTTITTNLDNRYTLFGHLHAISDVTGLQAALDGKVDDATLNNYQLLSEKGQANGYAPLDGSGLIEAQYLPSYVDDVLEYANQAGFPATGETGKLYVALDSNFIYRWSGSTYIQVGGGGAGAVDSVFGRVGAIIAQSGDYSSFYVLKAGDTMTGNLNVPTLFSTNDITRGFNDSNTSGVILKTISANPILEFQRWSGVGSDFRGTRVIKELDDLVIQHATTAPTGSQVFNERFRFSEGGNFTATGTGAFNSLQTNATGDGAVLLTFNTERPWSFKQGLTGAAASLDLVSSNANKLFNIGDLTVRDRFQFQCTTGSFTATGRGTFAGLTSTADNTFTGGINRLGTSGYQVFITGGVMMRDYGNSALTNGRFYFQDDAFHFRGGGEGEADAVTNTSILVRSGGTEHLVWHAGNDGASSGLDADLLDGFQATDFARDGQNFTYNRNSGGIASFRNNPGEVISNNGGARAALEVYQATAGSDAFMAFHVAGDYALYFGVDGATNDLSVGGWSAGNAKYRVWHANNDGAGSGLDADLLQGAAPSESQSNSTIVKRTGSGYIYTSFYNGSGTFSTSGASSGMGNFTGTNGTDTFGRSYNATGASVYLATAKQFTESGDAVSTGDFNAIPNTSMLTSINATANTPFGNAWYTFYQSRHRGGQSDGSSWASQIAIGMTSHQTKMAFRTESSNVWDTTWTEVITSAPANQTLGGDLYVVKSNAWLTLDSPSTGGDGTDQGAGISVGESGYKGGAAVHLTYTGNGYGYLGMGSVNSTSGRPQYEVLEMFYLDNTARFKGAITAVGNITANSDRRLKTNIKPIENALEKIHQLDGCTWDRTDIELTQAGFIAQDMQKVLPMAVKEGTDEDKTLTVDQGNAMTALLLQAVKELTARVKQLEKQNK